MRRARRLYLLAAVPLLFALVQGDCLPRPAEKASPAKARDDSSRQSETQPPRSPARAEQALARRVQHELRLLPYYSVFDWLEFRVRGYQVALSGYTIRPTLKSDAEARVMRLEGVERVINGIEVLPLSNHDDRLRRALYRSIYSRPGLQKYANQPIPAIHIIVNRGHVILKGVVLNDMDRNIAGITARTVPGSFSVTNDLLTER